MGGAIPELVILGSIRKQDEQTRGSKPVSNIPSWPLHQFLLPDLLETRDPSKHPTEPSPKLTK